MATISKTKNGRIKVVSLTLKQLQETIDSVTRPRIKRKYQNRINILLKKENRNGNRN